MLLLRTVGDDSPYEMPKSSGLCVILNEVKDLRTVFLLCKHSVRRFFVAMLLRMTQPFDTHCRERRPRRSANIYYLFFIIYYLTAGDEFFTGSVSNCTRQIIDNR